MKKTFLMMAALVAASSMLTGCKEDTQPRLEPAPEGSFKLYEPAMNNYTFYLDDASTVKFTTSGQPDYGVATPTQYQVQISYLEDTSKWIERELDEDGNEIVEGTCWSLTTIGTESVINASGLELSAGMCYLMGVKDETLVDKYDPTPRPLYVRVRAYISDPGAKDGYVPYSQMFSNVIKLNSVAPMLVIPKPDELYVIGTYQGWTIAGNDKTVTVTEEENGMGSKIYTGYVLLSPENNAFRFYEDLGNWDEGSIGATEHTGDSDNLEIKLDSGEYSGDLKVGSKDNWKIMNLPKEVWVKLTVNLKSKTVSFAIDESYVPED